MKTKVNLALKITILILVSITLIFYILATASDHWQETSYNVGVHTVGVFTGNVPNDLYRYTSSHSGLWRGCAVLNNKKLCSIIRVQHAWIRSVRAFMALAIIATAVVLVFVIASFFRLDLVFKFPGVMAFVSALFSLLALAIFTGKSGVPTDNFLQTSKFSWSFIVGWTGWAINIVAGVMCFIVPDIFETFPKNTVQS